MTTVQIYKWFTRLLGQVEGHLSTVSLRAPAMSEQTLAKPLITHENVYLVQEVLKKIL